MGTGTISVNGSRAVSRYDVSITIRFPGCASITHARFQRTELRGDPGCRRRYAWNEAGGPGRASGKGRLVPMKAAFAERANPPVAGAQARSRRDYAGENTKIGVEGNRRP